MALQELEELRLIQAKIREIRRKKRIQRHVEEKYRQQRDEDPESALLENVDDIEAKGEESHSAEKVNKFLKQKVIEHTEVAPGKMSAAALRRQRALAESKKRSKQKFASDFTEGEL